MVLAIKHSELHSWLLCDSCTYILFQRTQDIVDNAFIRCLPNNCNESNKYTKDTRLTRKITDLFHQKFPSKHNDTPKVPFHGDPSLSLSKKKEITTALCFQTCKNRSKLKAGSVLCKFRRGRIFSKGLE